MRIWQRRAIACTFTPERSVMVSANVRVGVAAYRSAVAPVQPKMRSAISVLFQLGLTRPGRGVRSVAAAPQRYRAPPQSAGEGRHGRARFRAAVEALPFHPQFPD